MTSTLGEFDQKGSVRTKYGTRDEYLAAIRTAQAAGIRVYAMQWHWWHFNASDANSLVDGGDAVYLFEGKRINEDVDLEKGNFDDLMGCDLDVDDPDVRSELYDWGEWYIEESVTTDDGGWGAFRCQGQSVSAWLPGSTPSPSFCPR